MIDLFLIDAPILPQKMGKFVTNDDNSPMFYLYGSLRF